MKNVESARPVQTDLDLHCPQKLIVSPSARKDLKQYTRAVGQILWSDIVGMNPNFDHNFDL